MSDAMIIYKTVEKGKGATAVAVKTLRQNKKVCITLASSVNQQLSESKKNKLLKIPQ